MKKLPVLIFIFSFINTGINTGYSSQDNQGIALIPDSKEQTTKVEGLNKEYKDPLTGMEFVFVKGGCYQMGDAFGDGENNERPLHEVCVDDFYMGKHEVTNLQFGSFIDNTRYITTAEKTEGGWGIGKEGAIDWGLNEEIDWKHPLWPADSTSGKMNHPVVQVSWDDTQEFIKWLNRKPGIKYRLATEAEWEYAASSGGKKYKYSWGNGSPSGNIADESAKKVYPNWTIWDDYNDGYVYTAPAGSFRPNELGLYDMTGNVWEWVQDVYNSDAYSKHSRNNPEYESPNPLNSDIRRVNRGGSWFNLPVKTRVSARISNLPSFRSYVLGFRLVYSAKPLKNSANSK